MFLKFIKDFKLKKIIKKKLLLYKQRPSSGLIKNVGVIVDEQYFADKQVIIDNIVQQGLAVNNIQLLSFKEKVKKNEVNDTLYFTRTDVGANGIFIKSDVADFINYPFDLLISYYDTEKAPLIVATLQSKAKFKAGFSSVNKKLNNFMVETVTENPEEYITELFRYLKILKKL